ncbi:uncharacterized protein SAPINGB_P001988 [Magnusiomyces paraingens]|uniref:Uncharacterized protein n=1 Tax=Magnusiomyces paraingens TaxID=2606893 RepID=A0A5E8BCU0_9ASCO|nr:uncharacterized protein SAPINGB_P001988 [Saprochaete ingens]VVT48864.1 unnamed protein product [Saprochaete ingens]
MADQIPLDTPNDYRVYLTNLRESVSLHKHAPKKALEPFTVNGFSSHSLPYLGPEIRRFEYHSPSKRDILKTLLLPPQLPIMRLLTDKLTRDSCEEYKHLDYSRLPADSICSHFYSQHMARLRKSLGLFLPGSEALELSVTVFLDDQGWLFPVNTTAGFFNIVYLVINNLPYPERLQRKFLIPVMLIPDLNQCAMAIDYNKDSETIDEYFENYNFLARSNAGILDPLVRVFQEMSQNGFYVHDNVDSTVRKLVKVHWTHASSDINLLLGHSPTSSHLTLPLEAGGTPIDSKFYMKKVEPKIKALLQKIAQFPSSNKKHWDELNRAYGFKMTSALLGSHAPPPLDLSDSFPPDLSRIFKMLCRELRFLDPEYMGQFPIDKDSLEQLRQTINSQTSHLILGNDFSPKASFTPHQRSFFSHIIPILPYWFPNSNPVVEVISSISVFLKCLALSSCPVTFLPVCSTVLAILEKQYNRFVEAADQPSHFRLDALHHLPKIAHACGPLRDYMVFDLSHAEPAIMGEDALVYDMALMYLPGGSQWVHAEEECMAQFLERIAHPPKVAADRDQIVREYFLNDKEGEEQEEEQEEDEEETNVDEGLEEFVKTQFNAMDGDNSPVLRLLKSVALPQILPPINSESYVRVDGDIFKICNLVERVDGLKNGHVFAVVRQVENLELLPLSPTTQGIFDYAVEMASETSPKSTKYRGNIGVGLYSYEERLGPKLLVEVDKNMVHLIVLKSEKGLFFIDPTIALQIQTHQKTIYI